MHVVYNPNAAQGRAGERRPDVEARLKAAGIDYEIHLTERPGHAIEITRELALSSDVDVVVAAGGDGTVNEVINGLMLVRQADNGSSRHGVHAGNAGTEVNIPALAVLTIGRGNDLAYGTGVPLDLDAAIECLLDGHRQPLDVGLLRGGDFPEGRYFGNGVGIGFDAVVAFEAAKMKLIKGFASYVIAAVKTILFRYDAVQLIISDDSGERRQDVMLFSIMNGRRMGGSFLMTPEAVTNDGRLDLCIVGKPRRFQMIRLLFAFMTGKQGLSSHVTFERVTRVRLEATTGSLPMHADGETIAVAGTELDVELFPAALMVITPARDH